MLGGEGAREEIRRGNKVATSKVTPMTGAVAESTGLGASLGVNLEANHSTFRASVFLTLDRGPTRTLVYHCIPSTWSSAQHTVGAQ